MARTCYYELLGVERSANDADLKKAYRRLALVWHPDKNHGNVEEATQVFAEIKEAYETLSDPQERSWYDDHREQILRGDDAITDYGQADMGTSTSYMQTESLMRYFSATSFRGFGDTPDGFFAVYRELFARLRDEELQQSSSESEDDLLLNLNFGGPHTHYDEDAAYAQGRTRGTDTGTGSTLRDFYNFWTTFSTCKSFGWLDRYRLADADNRQVRRLMEKENRRLREKARREFVETVQNLATWVRKRDPRYKSFVALKQQQQRGREEERVRRLAEQRAAAAEDASTYVCQAWEEVDYTSMLGKHGLLGDGAESPQFAHGELEELGCVICDKSFKTAAQKANHEKSKKHLKVVREARREMLREERQMAKMQKQQMQGTPEDEDSEAQDSDSVAQDSDSVAQDSDSTAQLTDSAEEDALAQLIQELAIAQSSASKKSKRKKRPQPNPEPEEPEEPVVNSESITDQEPAPDVVPTHRPTKRDMRRERQKKQAQNELACNVCAKEFTSRNHLFNHINDTGHALAKQPKKAK
ncbi:hypothetical protein IW142_004936 [Coemansia sp. RSA 564]|nr:hypothetical protein IW142_004936 [Coemansia sp. RSA 564]